MSRLFDPGLAYPCDDTGAYVEVEGDITEAHEGCSGVRLTVDAPEGSFQGWTCEVMAGFALKAKRARIRVYDAGGGFYPDNQVVSLSE